MALSNRVVVGNERAYLQRAAQVKNKLKDAGYSVPKYRRELFELIGGIIGQSGAQVRAAPLDALEACLKVLRANEKNKGHGAVTPGRLVKPLDTGRLNAEKHWGRVLRRLEGVPRPLSIEGRGELG